MGELVVPEGGSPFDGLKRTDEQGEYWTARDLQALLAYDQWRRFEDAIERAQLAAKNAGHDVDRAFCRLRQEGTGGAPRTDYRLTRFGAYLVAMNGDPRKARVAEAQAYFAVKTREAEVGSLQLVPEFHTPKSFAQALQLAATQALEIEEKDRQIEEQRAALDWAEPRAAYVDKFVDGAGDASTVRDLAKQVDVPEKQLRAWMIDRHLIYVVKTSGANEYRPRAVLGPRKHWFILADQPQAPRYHNGQMRKTLYITPAGKTGIEALLLKYPITGQGELDIDEAS